MKNRSDEANTNQQSRRSFTRSIAAAVMAVPLLSSVANSQTRRRGRRRPNTRPNIRTDIPPIIIKALKSGGLEFFSNGLLRPTGPSNSSARPNRREFHTGTFESVSLEFYGMIKQGEGDGTPTTYRNDAAAGCEIRFFLDDRLPSSNNPNVVLWKCRTGCGGYVIDSHEAIVGDGGGGDGNYANRYYYPAGTTGRGNIVNTVQVRDKNTIVIYQVSDPLFDYTEESQFGDQSKLRFVSIPLIR